MSNKSQVAPGLPKMTMTWLVPTALTATSDPFVRFTTPVPLTPLALRVTPATEFDRTTEDETYVVSLEDDGTKISTDNAAVTTALKTGVIEATFAAGTHVDKDSVLEVVLTLGGTSPIIPVRSVVQLDYVEG